ncbi:ORF6C domain-containing protein [Enterococcus alcedinis]|uniref:Antirepressor n=1 Tax=Enterococcus alcedinis TaxID=1274384 RepID=A0A917JDG1_9ENTE|nr:ORF6C domain-containing protein [Enterococcus alcedinis]MBP2100976.1 hypothetical protein [Enterococcus alcedinis]GGI64726.1 antirepressor [Enterococcus alcedinis]
MDITKTSSIEGKHYIRLEGEELVEFKRYLANSEVAINKYARQLILYTKQGAGRHSKMLGTDQAWDMFDALEENYFNQAQQLKIPTSPRELIELALAGNVETNQRVDDLDDRLTEIEENKLITNEDKGTIDRAVRRKVSQICNEWRLDQSAKSMLFADLGRSIKQLFNVPNRGRIKDKDFMRALDFVHHWEPSSVTKARIQQTRLDLV